MEQVEYDSERTKYFETLGYKVIRFWNNDVMNRIDSVLAVILDTVNEEISRSEN